MSNKLTGFEQYNDPMIMDTRVDFFVKDFERLIQTKGANVEWERAFLCQCITRDTGHPDFLCKLCHGSGYRYLPPKNIKVVASTFASASKLESIGMREPGSAYATPQLDVIMGYRDRLRFVDFKCIHSETLRFDYGSNISQKTHRNISQVLHIMRDDSVFAEGVDFKLADNAYQIIWLNDSKENDFVDMSILYYTTPSYLVSDLMHELRSTQTQHTTKSPVFRELPKQYQIQREDFIYGIKLAKNEEKKTKELSIEDDEY